MLFPVYCLANHPITQQISHSVISAICSDHIYSDRKISLHLTLTGIIPKCLPHTGNSIHFVHKAPFLLSLFFPPFFRLARLQSGYASPWDLFCVQCICSQPCACQCWQFYKEKQCTTFCLPDVTFISGLGEPGGLNALGLVDVVLSSVEVRSLLHIKRPEGHKNF